MKNKLIGYLTAMIDMYSARVKNLEKNCSGGSIVNTLKGSLEDLQTLLDFVEDIPMDKSKEMILIMENDSLKAELKYCNEQLTSWQKMYEQSMERIRSMEVKNANNN